MAVPALAAPLTTPRVEHPSEDDDYVDANEERDYRDEPRGNAERDYRDEPRGNANRDYLDDHREDTESSHLSQHPNASSQGHPAPSPTTALLMAEELLRYRPSTDTQDNWQGRL